MKDTIQTAFNLLVLIAFVHIGFSWLLLIKIRHNEKLRTEFFGSIKTLLLGPKSMRLKYLFWESAPNELYLQSTSTQMLFSLARWSGWAGTFVFVLIIGMYIWWLTLAD